jgi:PKHD-type hydroxylase
MSVYQLLPSPAFIGEESYATWNDGFTTEQLDSIVSICDGYTKQDASIGTTGEVKSEVRKTEVSWIDYNAETGFIYDNLGNIARRLNGQFFNFDIWGFQEHLQYTVYGDEESHYTWHMDRGMSRNSGSGPRKLSLVLQLSDPSEYEGGDLQLFTQAEPITIEKKRGLVVAFPSFIMHRVTPVTSGIRKTMVVWLTGPSFR